MNMDTCLTCGVPIQDKPWTLLHDFCPIHQAEWWAEMDTEERQRNFQREWTEYIECVEHDSASGGELDGEEWDWADWMAEGERQSVYRALMRLQRTNKWDPRWLPKGEWIVGAKELAEVFNEAGVPELPDTW